MFTVLSLARVRGEAAAALGFVFLFQCCYSAAPVYLSHVVASGPDRDDMVRAILLFVALNFAPYLLDYAASLCRTLWMSSSRKALYEAVYAKTQFRPGELADKEAESSFAALVSSNGQMLVADCVYFVNNVARLLFASALSVTLISLYVLNGFAVAYCVSIGLCLLLLRWGGDWQTSVAAATEKAYNRLMAALPQAWQASALGEVTVVNLFMALFARRWRLHRRVALRAMNAYQSFDLAQALCIWLPATVAVLLQLRSMEVEAMVALAIVLPRLTETLLDVSGLMANLTEYLSIRGRATWLNRSLAAQPTNLLQRCDFTKLSLARQVGGTWTSLSVLSAQDAEAALSSPGRYRLTGVNGSGKTSMLLQLKTNLAGRAFYLPAHASLFPSFGAKASTGQRKLRDLQRSFALVRGKTDVILLDEWDANLDHANRQKISKLLDELAGSHAVVEVSHHALDDRLTRNLTS